jgi:hypothetical protein
MNNRRRLVIALGTAASISRTVLAQATDADIPERDEVACDRGASVSRLD